VKFPKDIFISYAHIDDESLIEDQKGWIADFHRVLSIRMSQLMGRKPMIWRDLELQGNHIFDQQIVDQFTQVAVMISILTPRYVKSEWCSREVDEYYEACQQNIGFSINNQARIFKVIKTPVKVEQHPEKIRNILGYEFYTTDPVTGRTKELSQSSGRDSDTLYWDKLDDLANDVSAFLESLDYIDSNSPINNDNQSKEERKSLKIYLAESSYETKELRDSLRRELQESNYIIYPDKQLPLVDSPLNTCVNEYLQTCDLAVHVVGENYGIVPEGSQKSLIEIQNELASAQSVVTNIPRLIWVPDGFKPIDDRQKAFIAKLNEGREGVAGAELIFSSLESFKDILFDKIEVVESQLKAKEVAAAKAAEAPPVSSSISSASVSSGDPKIVYLICDLLDIDSIKPLEDYLYDQGFEVLIPIFEGDESLIRTDHIENLKMCDVAIIFYDRANEIWLRSKTRDFLKISGYGRTKDLEQKILYVSGETNPTKERLRMQDAELINAISSFPEAQLNQILLNK
jgi:hypothetical protein